MSSRAFPAGGGFSPSGTVLARSCHLRERCPHRVIFDRVIELSLRVDVRFDPKATKIARRRNMSRWARSRYTSVAHCSPAFRIPSMNFVIALEVYGT